MMDFSYNTQAQLAHVGWAGFLVVSLWLLFDWRPRFCAGVVMMFGAVKEFIVERYTESLQVQGSPWKDFAWWTFGAALAILVFAIAMTVHHFKPPKEKPSVDFRNHRQRV